jgi:hypothetical protein
MTNLTKSGGAGVNCSIDLIVPVVIISYVKEDEGAVMAFKFQPLE